MHVVLHEEGVDLQLRSKLGLTLARASVYNGQLAEVGVQEAQGHHQRILLGVGREVIGDLLRLQRIAATDGVLQFEDVVILADAHEALDDLAGDGTAFFRHQTQLLHFLDGLGKVGSQVVG